MKRTYKQFREDFLKALNEAGDGANENELENQLRADWYHEMEPGDHCHVRDWATATPCTIVKKTATTLTVRYDGMRKAEDHKPDSETGGYSVLAVTKDGQGEWWECVENPNGNTEVFRWSKAKNAFACTSGERLYPEWRYSCIND